MQNNFIYKNSIYYKNYKVAQDIHNVEKVKQNGKYVEIIFPIVYAMEYWGPNNNGDAFPFEEMVKYYRTFNDAKVHLQHNLDDVIGYVVNAAIDHEMKRILVHVKIDMMLLPNEALDRILTGKAIGSSMGCNPAYDICSVCGKISYSWFDKCEHIRTKLLSIDEESGKLVYMINYAPVWNDVSIVAFPGDVRAYSIMQKIEGIDNSFRTTVFNFEYPEVRQYVRQLKRNVIDEMLKDKYKSSADIFYYLEEKSIIPKELIEKWKDKAGDFITTATILGIKLTNKDLELLFRGEPIYYGEYNEEIAKDLENIKYEN